MFLFSAGLPQKETSSSLLVKNIFIAVVFHSPVGLSLLYNFRRHGKAIYTAPFKHKGKSASRRQESLLKDVTNLYLGLQWLSNCYCTSLEDPDVPFNVSFHDMRA